MGLKEIICHIFKCNEEETFEFQTFGTYNISEVLTILKSEFPDANIFLSDEIYEKISLPDLKEFLRKDDTNLYRYKPELFDCDDFSYRLMGNVSIPGLSGIPFGIVWTITENGGHALNCFIDEREQVWLVEPQTDEAFLPKDNWKVQLVMM